MKPFIKFQAATRFLSNSIKSSETGMQRHKAPVGTLNKELNKTK